MSYHISNLGRFGGAVRSYADLDGRVPEAGDALVDMAYDNATMRDLAEDDAWSNWVECAVVATGNAARALSEWRKDESDAAREGDGAGERQMTTQTTQIENLFRAAGEAGDLLQCAICVVALEGAYGEEQAERHSIPLSDAELARVRAMTQEQAVAACVKVL